MTHTVETIVDLTGWDGLTETAQNVILDSIRAGDKFPPTFQQAAFIDELLNGSGHIALVARAGCGKTTTIIMGVLQYLKRFPNAELLVCAFNKAIADEVGAKLKALKLEWKAAQASTLHSMGWGLIKFFYRIDPNNKTAINKNKVRDMVARSNQPVAREYGQQVVDLVRMAKQAGVGFFDDLPIESPQVWYDLASHYDINGLDETTDATRVVAFAQEIYRQSLAKTDEFDYDDQILFPLIKNLRVRFTKDVIFLDEAQDLSRARQALARKFVKPTTGRMIVVGDDCQPLGTQVSVPVDTNRWHQPESVTVAIEELKVGDMVVSYEPADTAFVRRGRRVNGTTRQPYSGDLIVVSNVERGLMSRYTPNHRCFVNATGLRNKVAVYMMQRGLQFRIGKCKMNYAHSSGLSARMRDEKAEAAWILSLHDTDDQAFFQEQAISGRFGLPQLMFNPKKMMRGPATEYLPRAWEFIGNNLERAEACLAYFGRHINYPFFTSSQGYSTAKRPVILHATNLMTGMKVLPYEQKIHTRKENWVEITVAREFYEGDVVSLDVDGSHLYIADGITTHNCQAIYGFSGADAAALSNLTKQLGATVLPLSVTWRCPKAVVREAQKIVPDIQAADEAPEGEVLHQAELPEDLVPGEDAILCRNTAPLIELAYKLIRRGVPAKVEGRAIGEGLKALVTRWKLTMIEALLKRLEDYEAREVQKAMAKADEAKAEQIADKVATLVEICKACTAAKKYTVKDVEAHIDALFADGDTKSVILATYHRMKGREVNRASLYQHFERCPSKAAKQEWQKEQERNLAYVAITRAKKTLVYVG